MNRIACITMAVAAAVAAPLARADVLVLHPVADGELEDESPHDGVFETIDTDGVMSAAIFASSELRAVVEFDVSAIPAGTRISSATLRLYADGTGSPGAVCHLHASTGNGMLDYCDAERIGPLFDFTPANQTDAPTDLVLPADAIDAAVGRFPSQVRFMITMESPSSHFSFRTTDAASSVWPVLELTYEETGACCLGGGCLEAMIADDCAAVGGGFRGAGTSCHPGSCTADSCGGAAPIELGSTPFTTLGAATDGPDLPASCDEGSGLWFDYDIWVRYVPPKGGTLTVSTCGTADFDTRLAAYRGTCGDLTIIACNDDGPDCPDYTSFMEVPVSAGEPVLIRIGGYDDAEGSGTITLDLLSCDADFDGDGAIGFADLVHLLSEWGPCP